MPLTWEPLAPGRFGISAAEPGVDPMWVWADATHYRDHEPAGLDERGHVWLALEPRRGRRARGPRFVTREFSPTTWLEAKPDVVRSELQMPVLPERPPRRPHRRVIEKGRYEPVPGTASTLVGVIDSGCPFASQILRRGAGPRTRVLGIWDQDAQSPAFTACRGQAPGQHGYGCAIGRDRIDDLLERHFSESGNVDEDAVYREAGYDIMRWPFSHGAAVVGQIFGRSILGSAIQPLPGTAPPWDKDCTGIDGADLVFVDLSHRSMMDGTSAAVVRNVIDGLDFIESHVGPTTKRIVVNLSIGTARTLHEGNSILEQVLSDFVAREDDGIERWVVLPMGNENLLQQHGILSGAREDAHLVLAIPPGSEMPQYVTVRWPTGAESQRCALRVTPPGGVPCDVSRGEAFGLFDGDVACCGVISAPPQEDSGSAMSLLAFAPTSSPDPSRARAPVGKWRIELVKPTQAEPLAEPVHFWISPNAQNPCMPKRSVQAGFVDWDGRLQPHRWNRLSYDDQAPLPRDGLTHDRALSGMATSYAPSGRIVVVGGYVIQAAGRPATSYSSAGPTLGPMDAMRTGPDVSAPGDTRPGGPGLSVRGSRSGAIAEVTGTSFSVPLVVRAIVNCAGLPLAAEPHIPAGATRRGPSLGPDP